MADLADQTFTLLGAVVGATIAEVLRRGADRRTDQRANRDRLYAERRSLYPQVLQALGRLVRRDISFFDASLRKLEGELALVGSPLVRRAVDDLVSAIADEQADPVLGEPPPPGTLAKRRERAWTALEAAMRKDLGAE
ncbi:MAG TPA: hypothetical protein VJ140_15715 [Actinomycetota bacterium]|nr:hypothetical protein [Actinomycetota bacterium]